MKEIADEHIITLLKSTSENEKGFRLLMEKYQERLYYQIRRVVPEHDDANDVLQNTLIKIFRNIGQYEAKSQLFTWLYRIATNESLTFLAQKKRKNIASLDENEMPLGNSLVADEYVNMEFLQEKLEAAVAELPEKQKLIFSMRYYDEMKYSEIAEILETSVGALKASFHHAVKKIELYIQQTAG